MKNVLKYFNISPYHALVNTPNFIYYDQVIAIQKEGGIFRYQIEQYKQNILKLLKRI